MAVSNTKQLFTLSEAEECVRLVCKARQAGAWKSIWQRVINMEDLAEDLSWEPVSGKSLAGAMTGGFVRMMMLSR